MNVRILEQLKFYSISIITFTMDIVKKPKKYFKSNSIIMNKHTFLKYIVPLTYLSGGSFI